MTLPSSSSQQQSQHFLLKWNNHRSNMVNVFESLLQSENLVDVTLAVEGKFLKAHKIVLSACSPYFQSMFVNQTPAEKHPILIFHDMKFSHLKTLLEFMYRGEISIDEKDLSDILKVAEALSIRGLSSFESDDEDSEKSSDHSPGQNSTNNNSSSSNNNHNHQSSNASNAAGGSGNGYGNGGSSNGGYFHFQNYNNNNSNSNSNNNNQSDNQQQNTSSSNNNNNNNNNSCDSSVNVNGSDKSTGGRNQGQVSAAASNSSDKKPPVIVKRRRGRQPKNKNVTAENQAEVVAKVPPAAKVPARYQEIKPAPPVRQGVRRRIPRRYSAVTQAKRGKTSNSDHPPDIDAESDLVRLSLSSCGDLPPDLSSSEPLSEMSVRGLDLFKYASIEDGVYRCIECEKLRIPKTFKNKYSFQRHAFLYHEGNMRKVFPCPVCSREFSRPDKMKNHLRSIHQGGGKDSRGRGSHSPAIKEDPEDQIPPVAVSGGGGASKSSNDLGENCDF